MPIDPLAGDLLTLAQAARLFPPRRRDSRLATSTLWRWATRGVRGTHLHVVKVGGVTYTTAAAIRDFVEQTNSAAGTQQPPSPPSRRSRRAVADLDRLGI
jgi:hypothetical protein